VCGPARLSAQAVSGSILGTVTDQSGAAVSGAKVNIKDVDRNVTTTTTSNESGNYQQTALSPGRYELTVEKSGFNAFLQQNVTVTVGQSTRVDASLQVGTITQQVVVKEAPPELQTDRAEVDTSLGAQQITQLPVLNRNFTNLTLLVPGATLNTYQHAAAENPQQSTLVNTNGQMFAGTNYLLDGMNNNDLVLGIVMVNPPLDSVGETSIATSNYEPEYTQAGGAVVRVETKAGNNETMSSRRGIPLPRGSTIPELRHPTTVDCPNCDGTSSARRWAVRPSRISCFGLATIRAPTAASELPRLSVSPLRRSEPAT
jgi:hypothetical protein